LSYELIIRERALDDLADLSIHFAASSEALAERFRRASIAAMHDLLVMPRRHRLLDDELPGAAGLRRTYPAGFPNHAVYYRVTEDEVIIMRVLHAARDAREALGE
jgi:toxin ParE1/3/4